MTNVIDQIIDRLGADAVRLGEAIPQHNHADMSGLDPVVPAALVLPRTTEDVAAVLQICHTAAQPIAIQGGLTGLVGGGHPAPGEIALSLERMSGIEEVDLDASTLTALAGTPLQTIQEAAEAAGLLYGVDLGARGSCTIGGNVATNAGGNQVLRYGMTRRNVLGLEAVLADGTIVRSLNKMLKNNSGYDWTQLMIGSEGTLGVVTRVVVALQPRPAHIRSALLAVRDTTTGLQVLRCLGRDLPAGLLVFEAMWREFYDVAMTTMGLTAPIGRDHDLYLLVEAPGVEGEAFETALSALMDEGLVLDAVIASSARERAGLWALRESVYEHKKYFGRGIGFDISIPLARMSDAIATFRARMPVFFPDMTWVVFGHLADSNIHVNMMPQPWTNETAKAIEALVYGITRDFGGSISAEHGIGTVKRPYLGNTRSAEELALMRTLKRALDPAGILNPGRVIEM